MVKNNLIVPSIIVGIAIIVAAIVLKSEKPSFRKSTSQEMKQEKTYKNPLRMP